MTLAQTLFWATNKKFIDPHAARYTAIDEKDAVKVKVVGPKEEVEKLPYKEEKPLHAKYKLGNKTVSYGIDLLIEQADAASFARDEEITLMNWGNAFVRSITKADSGIVTDVTVELNLAGDVKKTQKKITWLSTDQKLVPIELVDFDYLITKDKLEEDDNYEDFLTETTEFRTKALADENVVKLTTDNIIQFDRKGYFKVDQVFKEGQSAVFFNVPTGKK
jgi:hypothetical protein